MSELQNTTLKTILLRTDKSCNKEIVYAKQYDSNSRILVVDLRDENGRLNLTGLPQLNAIRPGGHRSFIGGEIDSEGLIHIELTSQLLATPGEVYCDISIFDTTDERSLSLRGNGVTTSFQLKQRFQNVSEVSINEIVTHDYEYNNVTGIISFTTAPADNSDIQVHGAGALVLTSAGFLIRVEPSAYSADAIEAMDEFTTVADRLIEAERIFTEAQKDVYSIKGFDVSVTREDPHGEPEVIRTGGDGVPYHFEIKLPLPYTAPDTLALIRGDGEGRFVPAWPNQDYTTPEALREERRLREAQNGQLQFLITTVYDNVSNLDEVVKNKQEIINDKGVLIGQGDGEITSKSITEAQLLDYSVDTWTFILDNGDVLERRVIVL